MPQETQQSGSTSDQPDPTPNQSQIISTSSLSSDAAQPDTQDATGQDTEQGTRQEEPARTPTVADALAAFDAEESGASTTKQSIDGAQPVSGAPPTSSGLLNPKRKYDGLDVVEKKHFSNMSTHAYDYLYPRHLEAKKLKERLQELETSNSQLKEFSFYDQEGAWKIAPEYDQYVQTHNKLGGEVEFWTEQLENQEAGNKVRFLEQGPNGSITVSAEFDPSPKTRAMITAALNRGMVLQNDFANKIQQFEQGFKQKHTGYLTELNQAREKILSGVDKTRLETAAKKKLELFPTYVRHKPEVKLVAEMLVIVDGFLKMLSQNKQAAATNGIKQTIARNAGPTSDRIQNGAGGVATVKSAMDDFRKAKMAGKA